MNIALNIFYTSILFIIVNYVQDKGIYGKYKISGFIYVVASSFLFSSGLYLIWG